MRKVLLFSIFIFFSTLSVLAYETIIIKYPSGERWDKVYYKKTGDEAIVQYVPKAQSHENWKRAIFVHSYNNSNLPIPYFIGSDLSRMRKTNPSGKYSYIKLHWNDAIATRCTDDYKGIKAQCEFYRVTYAHNGIITLHYINRDKEDFKANYYTWYNIIKNAKFYNSYYRDERTFDKSEYVELW